MSNTYELRHTAEELDYKLDLIDENKNLLPYPYNVSFPVGLEDVGDGSILTTDAGTISAGIGLATVELPEGTYTFSVEAVNILDGSTLETPFSMYITGGSILLEVFTSNTPKTITITEKTTVMVGLVGSQSFEANLLIKPQIEAGTIKTAWVPNMDKIGTYVDRRFNSTNAKIKTLFDQLRENDIRGCVIREVYRLDATYNENGEPTGNQIKTSYSIDADGVRQSEVTTLDATNHEIITDFNAFTTTGIYIIATEVIKNLENHPFDNAVVLEVTQEGNTYLQRATRYGEAGQSATRVRQNSTSSWEAWHYDVVATEALTADGALTKTSANKLGLVHVKPTRLTSADDFSEVHTPGTYFTDKIGGTPTNLPFTNASLITVEGFSEDQRVEGVESSARIQHVRPYGSSAFGNVYMRRLGVTHMHDKWYQYITTRVDANTLEPKPLDSTLISQLGLVGASDSDSVGNLLYRGMWTPGEAGYDDLVKNGVYFHTTQTIEKAPWTTCACIVEVFGSQSTAVDAGRIIQRATCYNSSGATAGTMGGHERYFGATAYRVRGTSGWTDWFYGTTEDRVRTMISEKLTNNSGNISLDGYATEQFVTDKIAAAQVSIATDVKNSITPSVIGAVAKNTNITGATKCKITYDAKGLVTKGADLAASDIPNLAASKITSGIFDTARIPSLATSKITTLTGYTKPTATGALSTTDSLNAALGKLEKALDEKAPATTAGTNLLINTLGVGDSSPTDTDFYIAQYAGGGTTTTTYHRRPHSALRTYLQNNLSLSASRITSGVLPVERGGTGKTTGSEAIVHLGGAVVTAGSSSNLPSDQSWGRIFSSVPLSTTSIDRYALCLTNTNKTYVSFTNKNNNFSNSSWKELALKEDADKIKINNVYYTATFDSSSGVLTFG